MKKKARQFCVGMAFLLPNFFGFLLFLVVPVIMGFIIGFTDYNGVKQMNFVGISNFTNMFQDDYFIVSLENNLVYTVVSVPLTCMAALLLALAVNAFPLGSLFKTVFFFPYITSMVAVGIVWSLLLHPTMGVINQGLMSIGIAAPPKWLMSSDWALFSIIIVSVWKYAGYYMVMFMAGLKGIPASLYEAAEIDGASRMAKLTRITLPLLSPTTFMILILSIIESFQVFDLVSIMTKGGPGRATNVLVYRIYQEAFSFTRFGYASAMAYFLFLIILVITLVQFKLQKKWVHYSI